MLRWSLWSPEHLAKLAPVQRRQVYRIWLLRKGGILLILQIAVLGLIILLGLNVAVVLGLAAMQVGPLGKWFLMCLILLDGLILQQILVRYIASELSDEVERLGLLRGAPTCLKCGYDLRGNPTGPCPECGHENR